MRVELEVRTRDDSVDIEAERTSMTTIPMSMSGIFSSIVGIMASYPDVFTSTSYSLPNPPRK